ncbi:MAG: RNA polymerase sigma factor, partial [Acidimicrobiia bacterium]
MTTLQIQRDRFERIADEVFEPLQRYLRRRAPAHDAEDILSEVLLTVWRRIDDAPTDNPLPWCYGVARRALANHRRGDRRRLRLVSRLGAEPVLHQPDSADLQPDPDLMGALQG